MSVNEAVKIVEDAENIPKIRDFRNSTSLTICDQVRAISWIRRTKNTWNAANSRDRASHSRNRSKHSLIASLSAQNISMIGHGEMTQFTDSSREGYTPCGVIVNEQRRVSKCLQLSQCKSYFRTPLFSLLGGSHYDQLLLAD